MPNRSIPAQLPDGDYYMVTMQIADSFGGLTAAMLERAKTFVEIGEVPTTILTFDPRPSYDPVRERMLAEGRLTKRVRILNMHESMRALPAAASAPMLTVDGTVAGDWVLDDAGHPFSYTMVDPASGQPATISFTSPDGAVYLHEEREYNTKGGRISRIFTRYTDTQEIRYANASELYRAWFDEIRAERPTYLIVDSKYSATHFAHYERADTYKFHIQHGYHSVAAGHAIAAPLTPQRRPVLTRQERWDGMILLTERNKEDLDARFGATNNRFVVSNIVERLNALPAYGMRDHKRGVMIARLSPVKDIPLAMRIMKRVHAEDPEVTLDIYGGGPDLDKLLERRSKLGLDSVVTFHGNTPGAAQHFDKAAFTLLTSQSEMQPLVVMEAMGRGCPTIAHDIRYGPRDMIRDGISGFVVPPHDEALAAEKVLHLTSQRFSARRMSKQAWRQAKEFGHVAALGQWAAAIEAAASNRAQRILATDLQVGPVTPHEDRLALTLRMPVSTELHLGSEEDLAYEFLWMNRTSGSQHRIKASRDGDTVTVPDAWPYALDPSENDDPWDAYLQIAGQNLSRRVRVPIETDHSALQFNGRTSYRTVNGFWSLRK